MYTINVNRPAAKFISHLQFCLLNSRNKGPLEVYVEESYKCRNYCPTYRDGGCHVPDFDEAMRLLVMDLIGNERKAAEARKAGAKPHCGGSGTTQNNDRAELPHWERMLNIVLTITRKKINDLAPEIDSILNRYGMPGNIDIASQHANILRNLMLMQFELRLNHTINQLAYAMLKGGDHEKR